MTDVYKKPFTMLWHPNEWLEILRFEDRIVATVHFGVWHDKEMGRPMTLAFQMAALEMAYTLALQAFFSKSDGIAPGMQADLDRPIDDFYRDAEVKLALTAFEDIPERHRANAIGFQIALSNHTVKRYFHRVRFTDDSMFGERQTLNMYEQPERLLPALKVREHRVAEIFKKASQRLNEIAPTDLAPKLLAAKVAIENALKSDD